MLNQAYQFGSEDASIEIVEGQTTEPTQLIPIVLLNQSFIRYTTWWWTTADIIFIYARSNYNEFCPQLQRSLFDRHLRYHPPTTLKSPSTSPSQISGIWWYNVVNIYLVEHLVQNASTYGSRLLDGPGTGNLRLDACFSKGLIEWAKKHLPEDYTVDDNFSRLLGVNVVNVIVDTNFVTSSRSNPIVARAASNLLGTV